jgi:hypothetical protein
MVRAAWDESRWSAAPAPAGALSASLPSDVVEAGVRPWLAEQAALYPGADARAQAAFLIGRMAFDSGGHLAALALATGLTPADPADIAFAAARFIWTHGVESGEGQRFTLHVAAGRCGDAFVSATPEAVAHAHDAMLGPFVDAVSTVSGLGRPALRRLVADGFASGCLHASREMGREAEGLALGRAALATPGVSFANRDTGYQLIEAPADPSTSLPDLARWFLRRGGCCRAFTFGDHGKCGTCVHLTEAEQRERLGRYLMEEALKERAAAQAALEPAA